MNKREARDAAIDAAEDFLLWLKTPAAGIVLIQARRRAKQAKRPAKRGANLAPKKKAPGRPKKRGAKTK